MSNAHPASAVEGLGRTRRLQRRCDDAAVIRCNAEPYGDDCAIDLGVGNDWYNVSGTDRDTVIVLAEAVLAQLARQG